METLEVIVPRLSLFAAAPSDWKLSFRFKDAFCTGVNLLETATSPFGPLLDMVLFLVIVSELSACRWTANLDRPMGNAGTGRRYVLVIMVVSLNGPGPESLRSCA